jgi:hypothetical protein
MCQPGRVRTIVHHLVACCLLLSAYRYISSAFCVLLLLLSYSLRATSDERRASLFIVRDSSLPGPRTMTTPYGTNYVLTVRRYELRVLRTKLRTDDSLTPQDSGEREVDRVGRQSLSSGRRPSGPSESVGRCGSHPPSSNSQ